MKIVLINGSPKNQNSASEMIVAVLQSKLTQATASTQPAEPARAAAPVSSAEPPASANSAEPVARTNSAEPTASAASVDCVICHVVKQGRDEIITAFVGCKILIFVFPLYVDGIPSHLLRLLDETREALAKSAPNATVYCVVNNGFYEARQNNIALEMMKNFCARSQLKWGQGLGVGAGGMITFLSIGRGPMKNLGKALDALVKNILTSQSADNRFVEPNFPKSLYQILVHLNWRLEAKKHGLKAKQLYDQPRT
jgi:multimeric flavodoxin WrbA